MTDRTNRLPDLIVRAVPDGGRFGWQLATLDGEPYLTSARHADEHGTDADYDTSAKACIAAGKVLLSLVEQSMDKGEIVPLHPVAVRDRMVA